MPRKTKAEYERDIAKTRGKHLATQPGEEYDQPPASERVRRLTEIQCRIELDILMTLRQIDRKLGEMKFNSSLPDSVTVSNDVPLPLENLIKEMGND